jgi:biopolymer transport protein ExbB
MNKQTSTFFSYYGGVCLTALLLYIVSYVPAALAQAQEHTQVPTIQIPNMDAECINQARINAPTGDDETNLALSEPTANEISGESIPALESQAENADTPEAVPNKTAPRTSATLPHNLSPWGMFMAADWVVKTVMIGLAIASLLTWTVLVSKSIELMALKTLLRNNLTKISAARTLAEAANTPDILGVGREFIDAAEVELHLSVNLANIEGGKEGIKERVISSLSRIEVASTRRMIVGTGLLATIGAIAPFVGLLGTVWGIMNSFIGISQANTTNLAVVAPGIAEALLATALGLVAAIPAVLIYNHFTRQIAGTKALVSDSAAAVMRLVSRDLDRGVNLHVVKSKAEA